MLERGEAGQHVPGLDRVVGDVAELVERAAPSAAEQRGGQLLADVGELVADERLAPGVPREQRPAEPRIGLQQGQDYRSSGLSASAAFFLTAISLVPLTRTRRAAFAHSTIRLR